MSRVIDILCFGEPLYEFNLIDQSSHNYFSGFGGDSSNCAIAAARQGARVAYLSAIGDDYFGREFRALWQRENVDTRYVQTIPDADTGLYFVHHDEAGHHFSYRRKGSAASRIDASVLDRMDFAGIGLLQLSGISLAIGDNACDVGLAAIEKARAGGALVAFDTNYRPGLWPVARARAVITEAIRLADIALPSLEDAHVMTGLSEPDAIIDHFLQLGPACVVLTMGKDGCIAATADRRTRIAAYDVDAVDATGAGDCFDGALLADFLVHRDIEKAARYANAAAALATSGYGAVAPIPIRAEVERFHGE